MDSATLAPTGQPGPMQPGDYTPAAASSVVTWNMKRLTPPSPLYVTVDDVLHVSYGTSQANEFVTVNYRLLRASDGKIVMGSDAIDSPALPVLKTADIPLAEGFLLSVSCQATVATTRGQTFVRLFLNPKALGPNQPGLMLMADYVTTKMAPGYPNGRILAPTEGPGWAHAVTVSNPAAGFTWTATVPQNTRWRPLTVCATMTTDATPGARTEQLILTSGGPVIFQAAAVATQNPSTAVTYSAAELALAPSVAAFLNSFPMPPGVVLLPGSSIGVAAVGAGAGDAWTNIAVDVEEWLDNV